MILTSAASQNSGRQSVQISMKCVAPQATMNAPNAMKIQLKGSPRCAFQTSHTSVNEMAT